MEGRVPPNAANANDDPPLSSRSSPPPPPQPRLGLPPPLSSETYIVQIPRDQIYRVPPPENAKIVESYRKPDHKMERCGGKRRLWILITLIVLAAIVGAIIAVIHMFFIPKTLEFSVTKVHVKSQPTSHNKHASHSYEIWLKADNPNQRIGVSYENSGETSLSFKHTKIAGGKYPVLSQDAKESKTVHLTLESSNVATIPSEVEKSIKDTTSKTHVSLSLTINVPIKLKRLFPSRKDMKVTCDFKVSTLASGTHVTSQKCDTKF